MCKKWLSVRDLCFIGIFTAIIAVLAQVAIPMPYGVPMTMQTFAIPFAAVILGTKRGTLATLAYILLGAVGVPVFAELSGGLGIVLGPTGGFILSFPLMALAAGIGAAKKNIIWLICGLIVGAAVNFICGMLMFSFAMGYNLSDSFAYVVIPFLPTTAIKIVLVVLLGGRVRKILMKAKVLV